MTVIELQDRLALYVTAEKKILEGNQSYQVGRQQFTRADLQQIQTEIRRLSTELRIAQANDGSAAPNHSQAVFTGRR